MRFDLSGIGESLGIGVGGRSIDRAADEIGQAITWILANSPCRRVILFGLCSGADDSIHAALCDDRIVGVVAIDGCGYRTKGFWWHRFSSHLLPRVIRPSKWLKWLGLGANGRTGTLGSLQPGTDIREFPSREQSVRELEQLASRQVQCHFVYTGGVGEYFNHARQFAAMFPELENNPYVSSQFFEQMDHVAILAEDRHQMVDHVINRMQSIGLTVPQAVDKNLVASITVGD